MPPSQVLVLISDEQYAIGLAATLASVARHTVPQPTTYVVDTGLSNESKEKLDTIMEIRWLNGGAAGPCGEFCDLLPTTTSYASHSTWMKLLLPALLPPSVDQALYMDCDMIALTSLGPLWDTQLGGKLLAAVRDFGHPCGHEGIARLGWREGGAYFNAGLLLIDVQLLREAATHITALLRGGGGTTMTPPPADAGQVEVSRPSRQHPPSTHGHQLRHKGGQPAQGGGGLGCGSGDGGGKLRRGAESSTQGKGPMHWAGRGLQYHDQDVLNLLCQEEGWVELAHHWNAQLVELEKHPGVVHFTGPSYVSPAQYLNPHVPFSSKPWAYLCTHPHKAVFFHLLDSTPWAGWRPSWHSMLPSCASELREFAGRVAAEAAAVAGEQGQGEEVFSEGEFLGALAQELLHKERHVPRPQPVLQLDH